MAFATSGLSGLGQMTHLIPCLCPSLWMELITALHEGCRGLSRGLSPRAAALTSDAVVSKPPRFNGSSPSQRAVLSPRKAELFWELAPLCITK